MTNWSLLIKDNIVSENTKKKEQKENTKRTSVRRLQSWFKEKHAKQINLVNFKAGTAAAFEALLSRNKGDDKIKPRRRI